MTIRTTTGIGLVGLLALALGSTVGAQEAAPPESEPPAVALPQPEDSAVEAILAAQPGTPAEWARAAKTLADLRRPDLAKDFLKRILDANLDPKQLAALQEELGSALFVSLGSQPDLLPEGKQVADAVLAAAERELTSPQRLEGLVRQLQDPSAETRYRALDGLRRARSAAVGPLVAALADPGRAAEHEAVRAALVQLGSDAVEPLLAVLEASDPNVLVVGMRVLADLNCRRAIVVLAGHCAAEQGPPEVRKAAADALRRLVGHVPTKAEAAHLLAQRASEYLDQRRSLETGLDGRAAIWSWDPATKQPAVAYYAPGDAFRLLAARLAQKAYAVNPEDPAIRCLYLATLLEKAAYDHGLDNPLPMDEGSPTAIAAGFDVETLQGVLQFAMNGDHTAAATAVARILGSKGTAEGLLCQGPQPAPLVQALRHPDRRLRFAALEAILALNPRQPFAGSSYVTDALHYFIATSGTRRALVADYARAESRKTAGLLIGLGYQVDTAVSGEELIRQAISSPDYEVVLIAASLGKTPIQIALQQLRFDHRTAWLPVGIIGRSGQSELTEHLARNDPLAQAFVRPHTEEDARWQVEQLMARLGDRHVPFAQRQAQALQALTWLGELTVQEAAVFDLRRLEETVLAAQASPRFSPLATTILGVLRTPKAQVALVECASQGLQPLEVRRAALSAFRRSVEKYGLLLTSQQILMQYDRYNQSAGQPLETQQVLGEILDIIEAQAQRDPQAEAPPSQDNKGQGEGGVRAEEK